MFLTTPREKIVEGRIVALCLQNNALAHSFHVAMRAIGYEKVWKVVNFLSTKEEVIEAVRAWLAEQDLKGLEALQARYNQCNHFQILFDSIVV